MPRKLRGLRYAHKLPPYENTCPIVRPGQGMVKVESCQNGGHDRLVSGGGYAHDSGMIEQVDTGVPTFFVAMRTWQRPMAGLVSTHRPGRLADRGKIVTRLLRSMTMADLCGQRGHTPSSAPSPLLTHTWLVRGFRSDTLPLQTRAPAAALAGTRLGLELRQVRSDSSSPPH